MEKTRQTHPHLPHRFLVITLLVVAVFGIIAIEFTAVGSLIAKDGLIHLGAIFFIAFAALLARRIGGRAFGEFRTYMNRILIALAILGSAHVIEYLIDVKGIIDEKFEVLVITGFYTIAIAIMVIATMWRISTRVKRLRWMWIAGAVGCIAPAAVIITAFLTAGKFDDLFGPLRVVESLMLVAIAFIATAYFAKVAEYAPVLKSFLGHINIAIIATMLAGLMEPAMPFLMENLSLSELLIENVGHYVFYAGLTFICLAFDFPNHFGGIFFDLREIVKEEDAKAPETSRTDHENSQIN